MNKIKEEILLLIDRADLIRYFVGSELKALYKNKVLGFAWAVLDPFFVMLVYVVLVSVIFKRGGEQFPILLFSSLLPWRWFSYAANSSVKTFIANASLIQTVKFPLSIFPINSVLIGCFNYMVGLVVLIPMLFYFNANITLNILWIFPLILVQLIFIFGISMIVSVIGVYFNDLQNILAFTLRIGFYLSPALYELSSIPSEYQKIYILINPFASLFQTCKNILVYGTPPESSILIYCLYAITFFLIGIYLITKQSKKIPKLL
ncbi:MAG: ABC transporter permease [Flavobacteriales bacterium]|nr:ABC transporter permease [Flavobacteriales bacterium]